MGSPRRVVCVKGAKSSASPGRPVRDGCLVHMHQGSVHMNQGLVKAQE
ncbi:hypothetical protein LF41_679 [Lysobacter dokdonensis DS-58]|uniref:Uncharacterized protein n=1 Tax=Lysobacter dokdonensis DS-58 TaxID=1300345 RepID=A0A0A2X0B4_9GAMM|nr:hypothetical protein LF41_679 [Lysobacter dokdonensis DS-58]